MENHYFDNEGVYTGSAAANPGSEPPENAVRFQPPVKDGFWPVLNPGRDGWELKENHRGKKGWIDGKEATIAVLGPLPEGWSDVPPKRKDTAPLSEMRAALYRAEADPHRDAALSYQAEAEAWRLAGNLDRAEAASATAVEHLRHYLEKKEAIRARLTEGDGPLCYLTRSGTYHAEGCAYTTAAGEWLSLSAIAERSPAARPCGRCAPPALTTER